MSLRDWKLDTWWSCKNANKSQRSSAFLHSNKELNKEKMLILELLCFCLCSASYSSLHNLLLSSNEIKKHTGHFFFPSSWSPPFLCKESLQNNKKFNSRRKPGFLVAQDLALFGTLPTTSAALGGEVEVASCGEGAVTPASQELGSVGGHQLPGGVQRGSGGQCPRAEGLGGFHGDASCFILTKVPDTGDEVLPPD